MLTCLDSECYSYQLLDVDLSTCWRRNISKCLKKFTWVTFRWHCMYDMVTSFHNAPDIATALCYQGETFDFIKSKVYLLTMRLMVGCSIVGYLTSIKQLSNTKLKGPTIYIVKVGDFSRKSNNEFHDFQNFQQVISRQ